MYRNIDCKFWTDPKVRSLDQQTRYLFFYLITNPHTHFSGFYYLPRPLAIHETGLSDRVYDTLCHTLSNTNLAHFDTLSDTVFLPKMMKYQAAGEKNNRGAEEHAKQFRHSRLYPLFCQVYGFTPYPDDTLSDTLPIGYPYQDQDQDQNQDQDQEKICAEPATVSAPEFRLPACGKKSFPVSAEEIEHWATLYPAVDIRAQLRKMVGWLEGNPTKRKTVKGMPKFIHSWLGRAQDNPTPGNGSAPRASPVTSPTHVSPPQTREEMLASLPEGMRQRTIESLKRAGELEETCAN